ncbi:hypothetical protein FHY25_004336 [Xanthomonas arboricola]|uniref:hypothetical protein n=1 Tax=Xanthomonas campestris TaxID=339 RepID=UPI0023EA20DA|nr:hypothetical protein [Xanthomonas campestris]MCW2009598.1 hypothetical protein [Xanthomonas campestris]
MTIIFAAHKFAKTLADPYDFSDLGSAERRYVLEDKPSGIYFVADSMISALGKQVLSEYKKVHEVPVIVNGPRFRVHNIAAFDDVLLRHPVVVAFAGNLTTAHHILNQITQHLSRLIAFEDVDGKRILAMECAFNMKRARSIQFHPHDLPSYASAVDQLTAPIIAGITKHAFNLAIQSARRYKLSKNDMDTLVAQFILGVKCPKYRTYHLYRLKPSVSVTNFMPCVQMEEVIPGQVVSIGIEHEQASAQAVYEESLARLDDPGLKLFDHLISLIDSNKYLSIGHPAALKLLGANGMENIKKTKLALGFGEANPQFPGSEHEIVD